MQHLHLRKFPSKLVNFSPETAESAAQSVDNSTGVSDRL